MHSHTNSNIRFIINIKLLQFIAHKHSDQKWDTAGLRSIVQVLLGKVDLFFFPLVIKAEPQENTEN